MCPFKVRFFFFLYVFHFLFFNKQITKQKKSQFFIYVVVIQINDIICIAIFSS